LEGRAGQEQKSYDHGTRWMKTSVAKTPISRRTKPAKRARIRRYAEQHGLTYSAAEERLLDHGLSAEVELEPAPTEVTALFFGRAGSERTPLAVPGRDGSPFAGWDELEREWHRWRTRMEGPPTSWWAHWYVDKGLSAEDADRRAATARAKRVTEKTGTSWAERERDTGKSLIFWESEQSKNNRKDETCEKTP
jgi:hypothetical protein